MSNEKQRLRKQWWLFGTLGALLLGGGLCGMIESGFLKHAGAETHLWVLGGTGSLCLTVAGVVLLVRAGVIQGKREQL